jgi:hypothetical protein
MSSITSRVPPAGRIRSNAGESSAGNEKRKSRRVPLRWTLYLASNGSSHPVRAQTLNISSDGFYCLFEHSAKTGDRFDCDIIIPAHNRPEPDDVLCLRCRAQVVRVEEIDAGSAFGLGCHIEDYSLIQVMDERPLLHLVSAR